jgi:predicted glycosyltransferase
MTDDIRSVQNPNLIGATIRQDEHGNEPDLKSPVPLSKIWIDLDNTPHVPFFIPIIRELEQRGHKVFLTARDAYQVCELADEKGLSYAKIGRHFGRHLVFKLLGVLWRSLQLLRFCFQHKPDLALSHGSRSLNMLGNLLGIPTVVLTDYEHARTNPLSNPRWLIVAQPLLAEGVISKRNRIRFYRGIKEDVYVSDFRADSTFLENLGLGANDMIVTVRPPAEEAHYHNPESDFLLSELMKRIVQTQGIRAVLLPRNQKQEHGLRTRHPEWFADRKTIIPSHAIDGLNLIWISDFVVSGGGTMNREAAAMRVPVYSIFRGNTGAVDRMLEREGRLVMIHSSSEIWTTIKFLKRDKSGSPDIHKLPALDDIICNIEDILRIERR